MPSLVDMVDKGKAALISTKATIIDAATDQVSTLGFQEWAVHKVSSAQASPPAHAVTDAPTALQVYADNELTIFARGSGGCGPRDFCPATAICTSVGWQAALTLCMMMQAALAQPPACHAELM